MPLQRGWGVRKQGKPNVGLAGWPAGKSTALARCISHAGATQCRQGRSRGPESGRSSPEPPEGKQRGQRLLHFQKEVAREVQHLQVGQLEHAGGHLCRWVGRWAVQQRRHQVRTRRRRRMTRGKERQAKEQANAARAAGSVAANAAAAAAALAVTSLA